MMKKKVFVATIYAFAAANVLMRLCANAEARARYDFHQCNYLTLQLLLLSHFFWCVLQKNQVNYFKSG